MSDGDNSGSSTASSCYPHNSGDDELEFENSQNIRSKLLEVESKSHDDEDDGVHKNKKTIDKVIAETDRKSVPELISYYDSIFGKPNEERENDYNMAAPSTSSAFPSNSSMTTTSSSTSSIDSNNDNSTSKFEIGQIPAEALDIWELYELTAADAELDDNCSLSSTNMVVDNSDLIMVDTSQGKQFQNTIAEHPTSSTVGIYSLLDLSESLQPPTITKEEEEAFMEAYWERCWNPLD